MLRDSNLAAKAVGLQTSMPWGQGKRESTPGRKEPNRFDHLPNKRRHPGKAARLPPGLGGSSLSSQVPARVLQTDWGVEPLHHGTGAADAREDELQQPSGSCLGSNRHTSFPRIRPDGKPPHPFCFCAAGVPQKNGCSQLSWLCRADTSAHGQRGFKHLCVHTHTALLQQ